MPSNSAGVSATLRAAIDANTDLKQALHRTQMPTRFQAMVLGLTALRQLNSQKRDLEGGSWSEQPRQ